ncbi:MAG: M56 family metallopeptidase, partial [Bacteroidota bacterium]
WWKTLWWVYLAGVLIFGVNFLIQFGQLVMRLVRYPGHDLGAYRLVELSEDAAPYSFWNRIFLNPDRYDPDTFHQIFQHEQIHVTQKHSIDLLLAELLVVFQWFNPFAWLYRKAIEDNLEFLTDAEMLRIGNDPERYQLSLVKVAVPNFPNGLVASYNQNFLEKRIAMMKTKKSSLRSGWKYLTLLPLLLISVLQFNAIAQTPAPSAPPAAPVATTVTSVPVPSPAPAAAPVATPMAAPMPMPVPAPVPNVNPAPVPQVVLAPQASPVFHHVPVPQMAGDADFREMRDFNSWTAVIERPDICFQFISRSRANDNNFNYQSSRCFPLSSFSDLPQEEMGEFYLKRESGTMTFKGMFEDDQGVGNFSFNPDAGFVSKLQGMGYTNFKDRELWMLFLADMNGEYLSYLKSAGYSPSKQKLIELSIFYDDLDELKDRVAMLDRMGYDKPKLSKLIELQIHGVDDGYVADLSSAGFDDLGVNDLVKAKIHGLSSRFVTEMNQMGFRNLSFDRLTELAIHGVSTEYVNELKDLGYTDLSPREVLEAKIHGVSTERIAEFQKAGFTDLTLNEAKQMTIHGVDADLVRGLAEFGFTDLTVDEV